ncbi:MAG TPA: alpha-E domain-containing protein [Chitinophagales bacterium]|nr:alpha-E domain-containing protein [Chitinophagales bacterium]
MLSRIAESLFWMNRYVERAEGMLRMLKINYVTSLDKNEKENYNWTPVLQIFTSLDNHEIDKIKDNSQAALRYIITDKSNTNSIRCIITKARENARGVQDHITKEVWESINRYYQKINSKRIEELIDSGEQLYAISSLIDESLYFYGVAEVTMPRGEGWNFMNMGKFIERAIQTADILDIKFNDIEYDINNPMDIPYWKNLLLSVSGYEYYMKTYHTGLQTQNVLDMIIMNTDFPRSILYSTKKISHIMEKITIEKSEADSLLEKTIGRLRSRIEYSDLESISKIGLHKFLEEIMDDVFNFSNKLSKVYFAYH